MEPRLLEILVCPVCKGPLHYNRAQQELICNAEKLAFPVTDGVPVMLEDQARSLEGEPNDQAASATTKASEPAGATTTDTDTP
jgi:hypothetical protein